MTTVRRAALVCLLASVGACSRRTNPDGLIAPLGPGSKLPGGYSVEGSALADDGTVHVRIGGPAGSVDVRFGRRDGSTPAFAHTRHCSVLYEAGLPEGSPTPDELALAIGALVEAASAHDGLCASLPAPGRSPPSAPAEKPHAADAGRRVLEDYVREVAGILDSRDLSSIPFLLDRVQAKVLDLVPGTDPAGLDRIDSLTRLRAAGYMRCRAVAERDPSWCEPLDVAWSNETRKCKAVSGMWALVIDGVVRKGGDCASVLDKKDWYFGNLEGNGPSFCTSIASGDPDLCPQWFDGTRGTPICAVAALRGETGPCKEWQEKHPPWWLGCCEAFGDRVASFLDPSATPRTSPEMGAISGDASGCGRALHAGLAADLHGIFGVEDREAESPGGVPADCRPIIPWLP